MPFQFSGRLQTVRLNLWRHFRALRQPEVSTHGVIDRFEHITRGLAFVEWVMHYILTRWGGRHAAHALGL